MKHDNRNDGSCYITIYDEHVNTMTLCSVLIYYERNRIETKFVIANTQELYIPLYTYNIQKMALNTNNDKGQVDDYQEKK